MEGHTGFPERAGLGRKEGIRSRKNPCKGPVVAISVTSPKNREKARVAGGYVVSIPKDGQRELSGPRPRTN